MTGHCRTAILALAALAALGGLAQTALAEPVDAPFTWSATTLGPSLKLGDSREIAPMESLVVFSVADGPLATLAGRCLILVSTDVTTMAEEDSGTCVFQNAEGHQLWERLDAKGDGKGPVKGTGTWIGGTGPFQGASGQVDYDNVFLASPRDGVFQGTGTKRGTLVLTKP